MLSERPESGTFPTQRVCGGRVRVAGACPPRVCVPASSELASRVRSSSHTSGDLVWTAFARLDAP
eukprot:365440-Prymnesium_polylepis.1